MAKKHIHKYYRAEVNGTKVFACGLPDCNHHMPKHYESMIQGKNSICWNCGETFMLDPIAIKMERPTCPECRYSELEEVLGAGVSHTK